MKNFEKNIIKFGKKSVTFFLKKYKNFFQIGFFLFLFFIIFLAWAEKWPENAYFFKRKL